MTLEIKKGVPQGHSVKTLINVDLNQTNVNLTTGLATKVSKSGDTITGNLTVNGDLLNKSVNLLKNKQLSDGANAGWKNCQSNTSAWYYYEGADTTTNDLPYPHCIVIVHKFGTTRGNAIAIQWNANGAIPGIWINSLWDTWRGWAQLPYMSVSGNTLNITL